MSKVVLHIPHSSRNVPEELRKDILLSDSELKDELEILTDLYTDIIFKGKDTVKVDFSRFVCDVERFEDDDLEDMSKLGMGAVYIKTPSGKELRHLDAVKRQDIIDTYYKPHHAKFEAMVNDKLEKHNECFIIDCHSFNENTSYLDMTDAPDICIGSDMYHTPIEVIEATAKIFESNGYIVAINKPFSGSIVPLSYYGKDNRVSSIMIELNKRVYLKDNNVDIDKEGMEKIISVCNEVMILIDTLKVNGS